LVYDLFGFAKRVGQGEDVDAASLSAGVDLGLVVAVIVAVAAVVASGTVLGARAAPYSLRNRLLIIM
jgi:hypothetical protein